MLSVNTKTCGIAAALLLIFLKVKPGRQKSFRQHISEFDFLGVFLICGGVGILILAFNFAEKSWQDKKTIATLVVGCVMIVLGGIWECFTKRIPIIAPRLFQTRTTGIILVQGVLHAMIFFSMLLSTAFLNAPAKRVADDLV